MGSITLAHEPLAKAGGFLHVSTYFGDAVREGMTTAHVWEAMRAQGFAGRAAELLVGGQSGAVPA